MTKKYRLTGAPPSNSDAKKGDLVFKCAGFDYGCASEDSRHFGIEHISVTYHADGSYPFFTVPVTMLEEYANAIGPKPITPENIVLPSGSKSRLRKWPNLPGGDKLNFPVSQIIMFENKAGKEAYLDAEFDLLTKGWIEISLNPYGTYDKVKTTSDYSYWYQGGSIRRLNKLNGTSDFADWRCL